MSEKAARINRLFVGRYAMETSIISTASDKTVQIEELKAFIRKQRDGREVKKALAVKLLYQGYQYVSVVSILDVSLGAIHEWKQLYEASGVAGFQPNHQGSKGYLSESQKAEVLGWLKQKDIWTLGELEYHLASEYEVTYASKQSYYDLFEAAAISWKKTSKVNPKGDAEVVSAKKQLSKAAWHATTRR